MGLTCLLVVVWPATALCNMRSGGVAFGVVMPLSVVCPRRWCSQWRWALMLSGAALGGGVALSGDCAKCSAALTTICPGAPVVLPWRVGAALGALVPLSAAVLPSAIL